MPSPGFSLSDAVSGGFKGMSTALGNLSQKNADTSKQMDTMAKDLTAGNEADEKKKSELIENAEKPGGALKPPVMQPPPQATQTSPLQVWGSAAMWMAALGGLLTRRPLINSLNASAAVLNAYKQHDKEATDAAFNTWKVENDNAIKMFQFANDALKEELSAVNESEKTRLSNFQVRAKALGFEQAGDIKTFDQAERLVIAQTNQLEKMREAGQRIAEKKPEMDAKLDALKAVNNLQSARQSGDSKKIAAATQAVQNASERLAVFKAGGAAATGSSLSDEDLKSMAEQYLAGDKSVITSLGYGSAGAANRARLQDMIRQTAKAQGMSGGDIAAHMAEFQGMAAGERTLSTTQARIGLGAAEIQQLEPLVLEASKQLERTNYPSFNAMIQAGQRETGDPALKNLAVRLQGLKSAFSQVLTRGGVPTDSARATTDELFNTKDPPRVMQAAMDAMNAETGAIEKAPGMVRKQLRENISSDKPDSTRGPAPAHLHGKPIWPEGDHWVYEDGSPAK